MGLTLVTSLVVLPALEAGAAFAAPALVRSIGGTGRAALFPWGMAFNPVSDEFVVSDYLNYQLRRYAADGSYLGDLLQPTGADGDPESVLGGVAVDPTNGDVYVTKPKPDTLAHYDAAGNRLADIPLDPGGIPAQTYVAWLTVDDAGSIYALDSSLASSATHPARMIKLAPGGASVVSVTPLLFPSQLPSQSYGIDVAANGRIYLSDPINRRVQMIAPDGAYFGSFGFAGDASAGRRALRRPAERARRRRGRPRLRRGRDPVADRGLHARRRAAVPLRRAGDRARATPRAAPD